MKFTKVESITDIKRGDIVQGASGESYICLSEDNGSGACLVRHVYATNPAEWKILVKCQHTRQPSIVNWIQGN